MFRLSLVRGSLFAAVLALLSLPSLAQAHNGGCFPTVVRYQPYCTPCYTPCYRPLVYSQPLFIQPVQPIIVQPSLRPIIVSPYVQPYHNSGYRVIIR